MESYRKRIADDVLQKKLEAKGTESLKTLAKCIDSDNMNGPSFLMVLTAVGNMAYRRPDGVLVVPIGTLKN